MKNFFNKALVMVLTLLLTVTTSLYSTTSIVLADDEITEPVEETPVETGNELENAPEEENDEEGIAPQSEEGNEEENNTNIPEVPSNQSSALLTQEPETPEEDFSDDEDVTVTLEQTNEGLLVKFSDAIDSLDPDNSSVTIVYSEDNVEWTLNSDDYSLTADKKGILISKETLTNNIQADYMDLAVKIVVNGSEPITTDPITYDFTEDLAMFADPLGIYITPNVGKEYDLNNYKEIVIYNNDAGYNFTFNSSDIEFTDNDEAGDQILIKRTSVLSKAGNYETLSSPNFKITFNDGNTYTSKGYFEDISIDMFYDLSSYIIEYSFGFSDDDAIFTMFSEDFDYDYLSNLNSIKFTVNETETTLTSGQYTVSLNNGETAIAVPVSNLSGLKEGNNTILVNLTYPDGSYISLNCDSVSYTKTKLTFGNTSSGAMQIIVESDYFASIYDKLTSVLITTGENTYEFGADEFNSDTLTDKAYIYIDREDLINKLGLVSGETVYLDITLNYESDAGNESVVNTGLKFYVQKDSGNIEYKYVSSEGLYIIFENTELRDELISGNAYLSCTDINHSKYVEIESSKLKKTDNGLLIPKDLMDKAIEETGSTTDIMIHIFSNNYVGADDTISLVTDVVQNEDGSITIKFNNDSYYTKFKTFINSVKEAYGTSSYWNQYMVLIKQNRTGHSFSPKLITLNDESKTVTLSKEVVFGESIVVGNAELVFKTKNDSEDNYTFNVRIINGCATLESIKFENTSDGLLIKFDDKVIAAKFAENGEIDFMENSKGGESISLQYLESNYKTVNDDGSVLIKSSYLSSRNLIRKTYDIVIHITGYADSEQSFELDCFGSEASENTNVYQNENGDLVIGSDDKEYIEKLISLNDCNENSYQAYNYVDFNSETGSGRLANYKFTDSEYGVVSEDNPFSVISEETVDDKTIYYVTVSNATLIELGVISGTYDFVIHADSYENLVVSDVNLTITRKTTPEARIEIENGDIVIYSTDTDWLQSVAQDNENKYSWNSIEVYKAGEYDGPGGMGGGAQGNYFYDQTVTSGIDGYYCVASFYNDGDYVGIVYDADNKCLRISKDSIIDAEIESGTYVFRLYSEEYESPVIIKDVTIEGAKTPPAFGVSRDGNKLIISSTDSNWIKNIKYIYISNYWNGSAEVDDYFNVEFGGDDELVINGSNLEITLSDEDLAEMSKYTVRLWANAAGYGQASKTIEDADHQHTFTKEVTKEATCTEDGTITYTCSCGYSYTETVAAKGHTYDANDYQYVTKADRFGNDAVVKCNVCGKEDSYKTLTGTGAAVVTEINQYKSDLVAEVNAIREDDDNKYYIYDSNGITTTTIKDYIDAEIALLSSNTMGSVDMDDDEYKASLNDDVTETIDSVYASREKTYNQKVNDYKKLAADAKASNVYDIDGAYNEYFGDGNILEYTKDYTLTEQLTALETKYSEYNTYVTDNTFVVSEKDDGGLKVTTNSNSPFPDVSDVKVFDVANNKTINLSDDTNAANYIGKSNYNATLTIDREILFENGIDTGKYQVLFTIDTTEYTLDVIDKQVSTYVELSNVTWLNDVHQLVMDDSAYTAFSNPNVTGELYIDAVKYTTGSIYTLGNIVSEDVFNRVKDTFDGVDEKDDCYYLDFDLAKLNNAGISSGSHTIKFKAYGYAEYVGTIDIVEFEVNKTISASLNIGNNYSLKFTATLTGYPSESDDIKLVAKVGSKEFASTDLASDGNGYKLETIAEINPIQIDDQIVIKVMSGAKELASSTTTTSACLKQYLSSADEKTKNFAQAALNYGTNTYKYFNGDTLSADSDYSVLVSDGNFNINNYEYSYTKSLGSRSVYLKSASLVLNSNIKAKIYFRTVSGKYDESLCNVYKDGVELTKVPTSTGFYISYPVNIGQLGEDSKIEVYYKEAKIISLNYSAYSFVQMVMSKNTDNNLVYLCQSLVLFSERTKENED